MKRETSREAYDYLVKNRLLRGKQEKIIEWLLRGDYTSGETIAALQSLARNADAPEAEQRSLRNVNAWRARFSELQHRGLIVECGERRCPATKRRALVWRFTGRTKPLVVKRGRGAKAWKTLAMDLWTDGRFTRGGGRRFADRIRALGGKP